MNGGDALRHMLVADFWIKFNWLWTRAERGEYSEMEWLDCRELIADVLRSCGLERRAVPRRLHDRSGDS
jgi:hypothetical protein